MATIPGMGMDDLTLEVARSIRPHLAGLLGDRAPAVDQRLAVLLGQATAGVDVEDAILQLLSESPATQAWAAAMIGNPRHLPPEVSAKRDRSTGPGGYAPLANPHGGDVVDAERYACPRDGNYVWWRASMGQPVPHCPDHPGVLLVLNQNVGS